MSTERNRVKFDALRAKYLAARAKRDAYESVLRARYIGEYENSWLAAAERKKRDRLYAAADKAGAAFLAHVRSFSPRDWDRGVPTYWLYGELTYEDAARPATEPLSVEPPLAFGFSKRDPLWREIAFGRSA